VCVGHYVWMFRDRVRSEGGGMHRVSGEVVEERRARSVVLSYRWVQTDNRWRK
jgi:hypothetical protein